MDPLSIDYRRLLCENQLVRLRTLRDKAFGASALRQKFGTFHDESNYRPLLYSVQRKIGE